jgi:hypothetical protein
MYPYVLTTHLEWCHVSLLPCIPLLDRHMPMVWLGVASSTGRAAIIGGNTSLLPSRTRFATCYPHAATTQHPVCVCTVLLTSASDARTRCACCSARSGMPSDAPAAPTRACQPSRQGRKYSCLPASWQLTCRVFSRHLHMWPLPLQRTCGKLSASGCLCCKHAAFSSVSGGQALLCLLRMQLPLLVITGNKGAACLIVVLVFGRCVTSSG